MYITSYIIYIHICTQRYTTQYTSAYHVSSPPRVSFASISSSAQTKFNSATVPNATKPTNIAGISLASVATYAPNPALY